MKNLIIGIIIAIALVLMGNAAGKNMPEPPKQITFVVLSPAIAQKYILAYATQGYRYKELTWQPVALGHYYSYHSPQVVYGQGLLILEKQ